MVPQCSALLRPHLEYILCALESWWCFRNYEALCTCKALLLSSLFFLSLWAWVWGLAVIDLLENSETFLVTCLPAKEAKLLGPHLWLTWLFLVFLTEKGGYWFADLRNKRLCLDMGVPIQNLSPFFHLTAFLGLSFTLRKAFPTWKDGVLTFSTCNILWV